MHRLSLRSPWLIGIALVACTLLLALLLLPHYQKLGRHAVTRPVSSDFYKFHLSAERMKAGLSPYWMVPARQQRGDPCHPDTPPDAPGVKWPEPSRTQLGGEHPCLGPNLNPPIFMAFMLPLSGLPYPVAWWTWAAVSLMCGLATLWLMLGSLPMSRRERAAWMPIASTAMLLYYPAMANFELGQLGLVLCLPLAAGWIALRQGQPMRAGIWWGVLIAIKPFMAVLLVALACVRHWRAICASLGVLAMLYALTVLAYGWEMHADYLSLAGNVHWTAASWNGSWIGFFDRFFSGHPDSDWPANRTLSKALGSTAAMLTLAVMVLALRRKRDDLCSADAVIALAPVTALLITPLGWLYYLPWTIISVLAACLGKVSADNRWTTTALATFVVASTVPVTLKPSPSPLNPSTTHLLDNWVLLCLVLLFSAIVGRTMKKGA